MYYRFISTLSDRLYQQRNPDLSILIPIIDLIKQRQFFLALRLCDHLIGLNNELYSIHAIKSYVLYLSNCSKQALEIYNKLSKDPKGPANFDPDYVHFISFTLISTGQQESLLKLYEVASGSIFNSSNEIVTQHAFLALAELGRPKEQQQIALKLHKAFPENTRYLYWALISLILQMPDPNNQSTIDPKHSLLFSIAHRFLKTLLNQKSSMKHKNKNNKNHQNFSPFSMNSYEFIDNTSSSLLEIQNEFWVIVKVLELIGGWKPAALDPKRLVGVGGLSYDVKLFNSDVSPPKAKCKATDRQSLSSKQGRLNVKHRSKALKIGRTPSWKPLIADGSAVPQSLKLVRQDYLDLFDSDLGKDLRGRFLGLELMWRDRASEWANPEGLIELISRMIFALFNGDRNWHTMITINKALINLMRLDSATGGQLKDEVYKLFESLDSDQRLEGGSERGYSLALIDLENRLREGNFDGKTIEMGERLNDFVLDYFKSFSEKTCLFDDLAGYLRTNMTFKEVEQLIAMVEKSYEEDEIGGDQKKMTDLLLCKKINKEKLCRVLELTSTASDDEDRNATSYLIDYFKYLHLGEGLPSTSLQPADDLMILVSQALISKWTTPNGSSDDLYMAAYLLEICLSKSAHRYHARTILIRLYKFLGNFSKALKHVSQLGIKHVQHETLDYLWSERCSNLVRDGDQGIGIDGDGDRNSLAEEEEEDGFTLAADIFNGSIGVYEKAENDVSRWTSISYLESNYIKVEDLHRFKNRCKGSIQKNVLRLEIVQMESIRWAFTVANVKSAEGDAKCLYEEDSEIKRVWVDQSRDVCCSVIKDCLNVCLYDNRDFSVIKNLQRLDCEGVESQTGLGPSVGGKWLLVVGMTYFKVLNTVKTVEGLEEKLSQIDDSETNFFDECTKYEVDLYRFSKGLSEFVRSDNKENGTADKEKIENVDKVMIGFFKSLERDLKSLKEEGSVEELNNNDSKNNDKAINDNGIDKLLNERVKVVKRKRKYTDEYKVLEIVRSACKGLALFRLMRFGIRENLKKHSKVVALEGEILNEVRVIKEIVLNYYLSQEEEISKVLKDYKLLHKFRNINKEYFGEKFEDYLKGLYEDKKRVLTSLVVTLNKLLRC